MKVALIGRSVISCYIMLITCLFCWIQQLVGGGWFTLLGHFVSCWANQEKMFPGKDILRSAVLVAIGGIVALLISTLLEGDEGAEAQRGMIEIRRDDELNEAEKQPREHDERTCWEGAVVHILNILCKVWFRQFKKKLISQWSHIWRKSFVSILKSGKCVLLKPAMPRFFIMEKKNSSLLFLASQIIGNNTSAHLQSDWSIFLITDELLF